MATTPKKKRLLLFVVAYYAESTLSEVSHRRLFNFRDLMRLLRDAGFRIKEVKGVPAPFPKALGDGPLARTLLRINVALIGLSRTLSPTRSMWWPRGHPTWGSC